MGLSIRSQSKAFGGEVLFYSHNSEATGTEMHFAYFRPKTEIKMALFWLSGLTCTDENFITKACALSFASSHGIALVAPDTSPRGTDLPGEHERWDFGSGAGFFLDARKEPWSKHYRMESYVTKELIALLGGELSLHPPFGLSGHSMGGHGALTLGMKNPDLFRSVSAFAPIVAPSQVPWGQYAFERYLGSDKRLWDSYDACSLAVSTGYKREILIHQGDADAALEKQLRPDLFRQACKKAGLPLKLQMCEGYDHGYFFVSTFMEEHLSFHLRAAQNDGR